MPTPAMPPELRQALLGAGYTLADEFSESLGILALDAAVAIARAAGNLGGAGRASDKIGRNDPCPCGSGKKYKRCCHDKQPAATEAAVAPGPTPLETPDTIPCLDGPDGWADGMERLEAVLRDDADLQQVRYDELDVHEYLEQHGDEVEAARADPDPDALQLVLEGLATRYARTVDRMATLKRLARTLKEVAPRYRNDVPRLRALATGVAFSELPADGEDLPLATALFRFATAQPAWDAEAVQRAVAPDDADLAEVLLVAGSHYLALSQDLVAGSTEAAPALERLIARATRFEARLEGMIGNGTFPVAVPFCVWVVMHQRAQLADGKGGHRADGDAGPDDGRPWLRVAADTYGDVLLAWLDQSPEAPRAVRGLVRWLAAQLLDFGFSPTSLELLHRGIERKWFSFLPGEAELLAKADGLDGLTGAEHPAYAALLTAAGHGAIAQQILAVDPATATP